MPYAPKHPCNQAGCAVLTNDRYCPAHKKSITKAYEQQRGSAHSRGYTARWSRYSKLRLSQHPFCAEHLKRDEIVGASVTDHIIPHKGDYALFWDETNHQSLCKPCHDAKTAKEDGRWG